MIHILKSNQLQNFIPALPKNINGKYKDEKFIKLEIEARKTKSKNKQNIKFNNQPFLSRFKFLVQLKYQIILTDENKCFQVYKTYPLYNHDTLYTNQLLQQLEGEQDAR